MTTQHHRYRLARQFDRDGAAAVAAAADAEQRAARDAYAEAAPARERHDRRLLAAWDALKPGCTIRAGNYTIVIKRKNTWSVSDTAGLNWTMREITGLSRARVQALRNNEETTC